MAWKPDWLKSKEEEGEGDKDKLPKELEDRFKQITEDVTKQVTSQLDEKLKGLDSITAFAEDYKKEKEARDKPKPKPNPDANKTAEEINNEFLAKFAENPTEAIRTMLTPANEAIMLTRADNVKREVFVDRAEEFPYYNGDLKREIDEILSKQNLQFRNDPTAVANVYYTVIGKRHKEIEEGKIKSRFASATQTTSSSKKEEDEGKIVNLTEDMKRAAKLMGFSEDEYKKILEKEAQEVNV